MAKSKITLGSLPVMRGDYSGSTDYYAENEVTLYGMTFRAKTGTADSPLRGYAPAVKSGGVVSLSNTDKWRLTAGSVELANASETLSSVKAKTEELEELYKGLTQSDIIVGTRPSTGVANKIYRVPGTDSYTDWMYYDGTWVAMATYSNAIDATPTEGSTNLVTSGGVKSALDALMAIVADLETIAEGYVRVAGSSNPALNYKSYKYNEQGGFGRESVFTLFYPCLIGTKLSGDDSQVGKILFVLDKLGAETVDGTPMWKDIHGNYHKIDGSEGDVHVTNIASYYTIDGRHTIDGTEYDVFLKSRTPFTWQGINATHVERWGMSPDYAVSHADADGVQRMHSAYNPDWNGSYSAPYGVTGRYVVTENAETGVMEETYDADATMLGGAGGLHTTDKALFTGEQESMNMNPDPTKAVPFFNQTAECCNRLQSILLSEGGTFDAHKATLMGSGFSANDTANASTYEAEGSEARNGLRVYDKNGVAKYYSMASNVSFLTGASSTQYGAYVVNSWRNPWHVMEAYRVLCHAIRNGVGELEWFAFEGCKYKWRSIDGFAGPSHGEATAVVFKMMSTKAGASAVDPTDLTTSIAGNRVDVVVTTALLHGVTTQVSPSWWVSGLVFTEDENGQYEAYIERDQSLLSITPNGSIDAEGSFAFETSYEHLCTLQKGSGYLKNYHNEALMLPDTESNKTGGGLHTYVGTYGYFTGDVAATGKKLVRGFRRGYSAYNAYLSPMCVGANYAPSNANAGIGFGTCVRVNESEN